MKLIKDPATDILFSPISSKEYSYLFEPTPFLNSGYFYIFALDRTGRRGYTLQHADAPKGEKSSAAGIQKIIKTWVKINSIWGPDLFEESNKLRQKYLSFVCHVDLDSIKQSTKIKDRRKERLSYKITDMYLKPKYNLDRETEKVWGEIIKEL
jgi:hypothetical protein